MKELEFYIEPGDAEPHFRKHEVSDKEVFEFFRSGQTIRRRRRDSSTIGYGRLNSGRYLLVVYREHPQQLFVITAYDLTDRELIAIIDDRLNA